MTTYDNHRDFLNSKEKEKEMICMECSYMDDSVWSFREDDRSGRTICYDCVNKHWKNRDTGLYPLESGQGVIFDSIFLFSEWGDFFEKYKEYGGKRDWFLSDRDDCKCICRIKGEYSLPFALAILSESMIEEFHRITSERDVE